MHEEQSSSEGEEQQSSEDQSQPITKEESQLPSEDKTKQIHDKDESQPMPNRFAPNPFSEDASTLTIHVMLPAHRDRDDDDDTIHGGDVIGTLPLSKYDISSVLYLRAAVRQALNDSPFATRIGAESEPNLWYGDANGNGTSMVTSYSSLQTVLDAERVWLAPHRRSRPQIELRPHELAHGRMSKLTQARQQALFGKGAHTDRSGSFDPSLFLD